LVAEIVWVVPLFVVLLVEVSGEEESYSAVHVGHLEILICILGSFLA